MPITKGAIRKLRADKKKSALNLKVKTAYKQAVSSMRKHPSIKTLREVFSKVDRAAKTNVIHKNKASRLKSRLSKLVKEAKAPKAPAKKK
jgi:small subunit ribosomal protein S20